MYTNYLLGMGDISELLTAGFTLVLVVVGNYQLNKLSETNNTQTCEAPYKNPIN
jgi:hypothetical protein